MDENVGKIYCLERGNDDALAAAILANGNRRDYDPMTAAALMNQNQQWNNPFAYLIWMMFAGRFFGNGWGDQGYQNGQNAQNIEMQNQLQAIRTQLQDNQNSDCIKSAVMGVDAIGKAIKIDWEKFI